MKFLDKIFKRGDKQQGFLSFTRGFVGAMISNFTKWINSSFDRINADINRDLIKLVARTRDLAKNNTLVRAYLELCEKNIVGKAGFTLQAQLKDSEGKLNEAANSAIEWAFWDFGKLSNGFLTVDHRFADTTSSTS